jgi:hypothetical protein
MTDEGQKNKELDFKNGGFLKPNSLKEILCSVGSFRERFQNRLDSIHCPPAPAEPFSRMAVLAVLGRDAAISTGALPSS